MFSSVLKEETSSCEERESEFLGGFRSRRLFPPLNFDDKLANLRKRKIEFEKYMNRSREKNQLVLQLSAWEFD